MPKTSWNYPAPGIEKPVESEVSTAPAQQYMNDAGKDNQKDKTCGLPDHLPFPNKFSMKVEAAIAQGNILIARKQLISDVGMFYYGMATHPYQGDYKRIAIKVCEKFPQLKDSNASSFWVSSCSILTITVIWMY